MTSSSCRSASRARSSERLYVDSPYRQRPLSPRNVLAIANVFLCLSGASAILATASDLPRATKLSPSASGGTTSPHHREISQLDRQKNSEENEVKSIISGHATLRRLEEGPEYYDGSSSADDERSGQSSYGPKDPGVSSIYSQKGSTTADTTHFTNITATVFAQFLVILLIVVTVLLMVMCLMNVDVPRHFEDKALQINKEY